MNWNDKRYLMAGCLILGLLLGLIFQRPITLMAPAGDTKIMSSYIRNGFANRLMSKERRTLYSKCYDSFLKEVELKIPLNTPAPAAIPTTNQATTATNNPVPTPTTGTDLSAAPEKTIEGILTYVFHLTEDGKIIEYELAVNELENKRFSDCVEKGFEKLRFLPPPLGINRYVAYEMSFKKDETYLKELEDRKSNPPITLVPTPPKENQESGSEKSE
jgi:hypothetical protein